MKAMLKIGEKIRELRLAQGITQETVADYLNISCQAVSKWENGLAMPDITLLPPLANFFGVSADELLGVTKPEQSSELTEYEKQYFEFGRKGRVLEKIELCREALSKYPRNYQWMLNLAYSLVSYNATKEQEKYGKEHGFLDEAISICERVLKDCTDDSIRHGAIQILCYNYPKINRADRAADLANTMPDMILCREHLLQHIYTGEQQIKHSQELLLKYLRLLWGNIWFISTKDIMGKEMSVEQKIAVTELSNKLLSLFFDEADNNFEFDLNYSRNYTRLAKYKSGLNDASGAVECLLRQKNSLQNLMRNANRIRIADINVCC